MSGYVRFKETGIKEIDLILERVYSASRAYHHTSGWLEPYDELKGENSETYVDMIQQAADEAAKAWQASQPQAKIEPADARSDLFDVMVQDHSVTLLESELDNIIYVVLNALKIKAVGTTNNE